jgi:GNAT superfamily N-acetyltransferase
MIRKLLPSDEPLFRDHLLRLDSQSRHDRFLSAVSDSFLCEYARSCFDGETLVLGLIEAELVRAAGELHAAEPRETETGEVALSVEPEFRNKGTGTEMLKRLIVSARNRGFRHLRMNCHAKNLAMQAVARKFKAEITIEQGGTVGRIEPGPRTPFSLLMEALSNAREIGKAVIGLAHPQ